MKKTIKTIMAIAVISILFVSCNADLASQGKGIFESMMTSAPNADYTIKKFAGLLDDNRFLIETNTGIEVLSTDGTKTPLVKGLKATVSFVKDGKIYYSVEKAGAKTTPLLVAEIPSDGKEITEGIPVTVKKGDDILKIEASFYEHGDYYLLMADKNGYHYIATSLKADISDNTITFSDIHKCVRRTKTVKENDEDVVKEIVPDSTLYIGEGYYTVKYDTSWYLYDVNGKEVFYENDKPFPSRPMAVENGYLFLQTKDNNLFKINGSSISPVVAGDKTAKHTITYLQPNHDIPMITAADGAIYGCYGANPFSLKNKVYADHESIGSGVAIIDLIQLADGNYYAFSAENGLYKSENGVQYTRVTK